MGAISITNRPTLSTVDAEPNPDCLLFTTNGLFVTPIALTSHYNFGIFLTFLECFYMVQVQYFVRFEIKVKGKLPSDKILAKGIYVQEWESTIV